MKQRYEQRISELVDEMSTVEQLRDSFEDELKRTVEENRQLRNKMSTANVAASGNAQRTNMEDFNTEVAGL